jgi:hypothetical protein
MCCGNTRAVPAASESTVGSAVAPIDRHRVGVCSWIKERPDTTTESFVNSRIGQIDAQLLGCAVFHRNRPSGVAVVAPKLFIMNT